MYKLLKVVLIALIFSAVIFTGCKKNKNTDYWTMTFGGSGSDFGRSVQQTTDGGYILAGYTYSYSTVGDDVYLIKTDASGNQIWYKTLGGSSSEEYGNSVQPTTDGGYIITGYAQSSGTGDHDVYLIKTDANGNQTWSKTFGGSSDDEANSVQPTTDGGYIVAGYTNSFGAGEKDVYLIKTDANGNQTWSKTFGGTGWDEAHSIQQTTDGGYIITGFTQSYGSGGDVYLIKTDATGDTVWTRTLGGSWWDDGFSVQQTTDGGYIITGETNSYDGNGVYLIKADASGGQTWYKAFGGSLGYSVQQTTDGGYIVVGYTMAAGNSDVYLIKTDANGNETWFKTFGGSDSDKGYSVQQTTDGGYIIIGDTESYGAGYTDVYLIKTDANGNVK